MRVGLGVALFGVRELCSRFRAEQNATTQTISGSFAAATSIPDGRVPHPFTPSVKGARGNLNNNRKPLHSPQKHGGWFLGYVAEPTQPQFLRKP
jgi:hypothetical protein